MLSRGRPRKQSVIKKFLCVGALYIQLMSLPRQFKILSRISEGVVGRSFLVRGQQLRSNCTRPVSTPRLFSNSPPFSRQFYFRLYISLAASTVRNKDRIIHSLLFFSLIDASSIGAAEKAAPLVKPLGTFVVI